MIEIRRASAGSLMMAGFFLVMAAVCVVVGMLNQGSTETILGCTIGVVAALVLTLIFVTVAIQARYWRLTVNTQTGETTFRSLTKHCEFRMQDVSASVEMVDHKISSMYPLVTEQLLIRTDSVRIRVELGFPAEGEDDPYRFKSVGYFQNAPELLQYLDSIGKLNDKTQQKG